MLASAPNLRLARLATIAALRTTGLVPCVLAAGWIALAVAQEPLMMRSFGVYLALHATWVAAAIVLIVAASNLPSIRRTHPHIIAATILTTVHAVVSAAWLAAMQAARGALPQLGGVSSYVAAFVLAWLPVAVLTSLAATVGGWVPWLMLAGALALGATVAVPSSIGVWSLSGLAASMACLAAASAFAHIYCRKKA